ncbi:TY-Chap domain-containing protein [Nocardia tengchongensis]
MVIQVEIDNCDVVLSLINPHYQDWIDSGNGEAEADWVRFHGDERPSDSVSPSLAGGWPSFSDALALTLSRLPEDGQLTVVAGSDQWLRFGFGMSSRDGLRLKCEFPTVRGIDTAKQVQTGWAKPDRRNRNWAKRIKWPAAYDRYHSLAQNAVAVLHNMFGVDDPTSISVYSRNLSYEAPATLEAFKGK